MRADPNRFEPSSTVDSRTLFKRDLQEWPLLKPEESIELAIRRRKAAAEAKLCERKLKRARKHGAEPKTIAKLDKEHTRADDRQVELRNKLVSHNMRLVFYWAAKYVHRGVEFDDLVQEGTAGLIHAAELYRPKLGFKFSTYATWWIKQAVGRSIHDTALLVRIPVHKHTLLFRMSREASKFFVAHHRYPSDEELAGLMGLSLAKTKENRLYLQGYTASIEDLATNEDEEVVYDILPFLATDDHEESMFAEDLRRRLSAMIRKPGLLEPREQSIIIARFGLNGHEQRHTLEEIGDTFNLTRERIRQLEERALRKLRAGILGDPLLLKALSTEGLDLPSEQPDNVNAQRQVTREERAALPEDTPVEAPTDLDQTAIVEATEAFRSKIDGAVMQPLSLGNGHHLTQTRAVIETICEAYGVSAEGLLCANGDSTTQWARMMAVYVFRNHCVLGHGKIASALLLPSTVSTHNAYSTMDDIIGRNTKVSFDYERIIVALSFTGW